MTASPRLAPIGWAISWRQASGPHSSPRARAAVRKAMQASCLALETEKLVVSEALKFPVTQQTTSGLQTHGYEVDLVGARSDRLVLATVKSFFGSAGVATDHVTGTATRVAYNKRYALLNNPKAATRS
jgi:hypothetical protein